MSDKPHQVHAASDSLTPSPCGRGGIGRSHSPENPAHPHQRQDAAKSPLPPGEGLGEGKQTSNLTPKLIAFARKMRKNQTDAEKLIWSLLRSRQIAEAKFRRQHPIGQYIADFYCHKHQLIIELDGSQHYTPEGKSRDAARTAHLEERGLRVLRFDNRQVMIETEAVLEEIYRTINS